MSILSTSPTGSHLARKSLIPGVVEKLRREEGNSVYNNRPMNVHIEELHDSRSIVYKGVAAVAIAAVVSACTQSTIGQVAAVGIGFGGAGLMWSGFKRIKATAEYMKAQYLYHLAHQHAAAPAQQSLIVSAPNNDMQR